MPTPLPGLMPPLPLAINATPRPDSPEEEENTGRRLADLASPTLPPRTTMAAVQRVDKNASHNLSINQADLTNDGRGLHHQQGHIFRSPSALSHHNDPTVQSLYDQQSVTDRTGSVRPPEPAQRSRDRVLPSLPVIFDVDDDSSDRSRARVLSGGDDYRHEGSSRPARAATNVSLVEIPGALRRMTANEPIGFPPSGGTSSDADGTVGHTPSSAANTNSTAAVTAMREEGDGTDPNDGTDDIMAVASISDGSDNGRDRDNDNGEVEDDSGAPGAVRRLSSMVGLERERSLSHSIEDCDMGRARASSSSLLSMRKAPAPASRRLTRALTRSLTATSLFGEARGSVDGDADGANCCTASAAGSVLSDRLAQIEETAAVGGAGAHSGAGGGDGDSTGAGVGRNPFSDGDLVTSPPPPLVPLSQSPEHGGLVSFMCEFAFFIIHLDDPRVPLLRERAYLDANDSEGTSSREKLVEFPIDEGSTKFADGPVQTTIAVLSVLMTVSLASTVVALPYLYGIDVQRQCSFPPSSFATADAWRRGVRIFGLVTGISMILIGMYIARRVFGAGGWRRVLWRHAMLTWATRPQFTAAAVIAAVASAIKGSWLFLALVMGMLILMPLIDILMLFTRDAWSVRVSVLGLVIDHMVLWVRERLDDGACLGYGEDPPGLAAEVMARLWSTALLLYCFAAARLFLVKMFSPRRPYAMHPWQPHYTLYEPGPRDVEFEVFYGRHESRVVQVGSPEYDEVEGMRVDSSWRVSARRFPLIDAFATFWIVLFSPVILGYMVTEVLVLVMRARPERRCFEVQKTSVIESFNEALSHAAVFVLAVALVVFAMTWIVTAKRPLRAVGMYTVYFFRRWPSYLVATLLTTALPFVTRFPFNPIYPSGLLLPMFDVVLATIPRRGVLPFATSVSIGSLCCAHMVIFVTTTIRAPLNCDVIEGPTPSTFENALYQLTSVSAAVWSFQLVAILLRKVKDPSRLSIPFKIEPGSAYENCWFEAVARNRQHVDHEGDSPTSESDNDRKEGFNVKQK